MSSFLGANSAFGTFSQPATATRSRRTGKEDSRLSPTSAVSTAQSLANEGPKPIDNVTPSLGSWSKSPDENNHSNGDSRSFSSILSPVLPITVKEESFDPTKPFVYTREFLLSLYDEDKSSRRPIELARHDIGTRDTGSAPLALKDWREGEKEV